MTFRPGKASGAAAGSFLVRVDEATREDASGDFGGITFHRPAAVVHATSVDQVVAAVRLAADRGWKIGVQGQRHSTYGQAQVRDGLALPTGGLTGIHVDPATRTAHVDAGVRWDRLVRQTLQRGLIPPVLTDYLGLSVGGTLSVGGIGVASLRHGAQTDNVHELTVVTGTAQVLTCSNSTSPDLFDAVRAGLGQVGVITSARLRLVPAPARVRTCKALYTDLEAMLGDQLHLIHRLKDQPNDRPAILAVQGFAIPNSEPQLSQRFGPAMRRLPAPGTQPWVYQIKVAIDSDHRLLLDGSDGLADAETRWLTSDCATLDFADRMRPDVELMSELGLWQAPHPYLSVFLPARSAQSAAQLIADALADATPADQHEGPVIIQALARNAFNTPNLQLPDGEHAVLLSLHPNAHPPTPVRIDAFLATNRHIYDKTRKVGGSLYPIGSLRMTAADWAAHHGPQLSRLRAAKQRYDPNDTFGSVA